MDTSRPDGSRAWRRPSNHSLLVLLVVLPHRLVGLHRLGCVPVLAVTVHRVPAQLDVGAVLSVDRAVLRHGRPLELQEVGEHPRLPRVPADLRDAKLPVLLVNLPSDGILLRLVDHLLRKQQVQRLVDVLLFLDLTPPEADLLHDVEGPHRSVAPLLVDIPDEDCGDTLHHLLEAEVGVRHPLHELPLPIVRKLLRDAGRHQRSRGAEGHPRGIPRRGRTSEGPATDEAGRARSAKVRPAVANRRRQ
mmetsp:Transcript_42568/g.117437  ORF Transcript_42568/g.117437 Transcript_42568/m.117437 type:complete len:247 (+) Transcript_42568:54-794(+)